MITKIGMFRIVEVNIASYYHLDTQIYRLVVI
jgi:hypothetical protein